MPQLANAMNQNQITEAFQSKVFFLLARLVTAGGDWLTYGKGAIRPHKQSGYQLTWGTWIWRYKRQEFCTNTITDLVHAAANTWLGSVVSNGYCIHHSDNWTVLTTPNQLQGYHWVLSMENSHVWGDHHLCVWHWCFSTGDSCWGSSAVRCLTVSWPPDCNAWTAAGAFGKVGSVGVGKADPWNQRWNFARDNQPATIHDIVKY